MRASVLVFLVAAGLALGAGYAVAALTGPVMKDNVTGYAVPSLSYIGTAVATGFASKTHTHSEYSTVTNPITITYTYTIPASNVAGLTGSLTNTGTAAATSALASKADTSVLSNYAAATATNAQTNALTSTAALTNTFVTTEVATAYLTAATVNTNDLTNTFATTATLTNYSRTSVRWATDTNVLCYWKLNEAGTTSTQFANSIATATNSALITNNGTTWAYRPGLYGDYGVLLPATGRMISQTGSLCQPTTALTACLWVRWDSTTQVGSNSCHSMFWKNATTNAGGKWQPSWDFGFINGASSKTGMYFEVLTAFGSTASTWLVTDLATAPMKWTSSSTATPEPVGADNYYCGVFDGSHVYAYRNGVLITSSTHTHTSTASIVYTTAATTNTWTSQVSPGEFGLGNYVGVTNCHGAAVQYQDATVEGVARSAAVLRTRYCCATARCACQ
jgi:hypothetical protein